MSQTSSRLLRLLRDLALALLNATLILTALCLFLGLRLADRLDTAVETFARSLVDMDRLHDELQVVAGEIEGLRTEIAAFRQSPIAPDSRVAQELEVRLAAFDERMEAVDAAAERIGSADVELQELLDHGIERAAAALAAEFGQLAGCETRGTAVMRERALPLREQRDGG